MSSNTSVEKQSDLPMGSYDEDEKVDTYVEEDEGIDVDSTVDTTHGSTSSSNDEKKAVYKMSAKDTRRVQLGRVGAILVLLLTALGVTLTTYKLLKNEESNSFETAVS
jgi:hypothetical protein